MSVAKLVLTGFAGGLSDALELVDELVVLEPPPQKPPITSNPSARLSPQD